MTTPSMSFRELVQLAAGLGCSDIEVRNDLSTPLFDGIAPEEAKALARAHGITLSAIAQVSAFNDGSNRALDQLHELADVGSRCGAKGVSLIPWLASSNSLNGHASAPDSREAIVEQLSYTLADFAPVLEQHELVGFIEPLGFKQASLRFKADAVAAITALGSGSCAPFQLVHDTFHHCLADEGSMFPEHTGMVHVSGVLPTNTNPVDFTDADRVLVNSQDVLGNLEQLEQLTHGGYEGPISIEAFAPAVHRLQNPEDALLACFNYIGPSLQTVAA